MGPPKDGSRVLIRYYHKGFNFRSKSYERYPEPTWREAWWKDKDLSGSKPHWQPWCGSYRVSSTHHIMDEDIVDWMELPKNKS
tara:strand:+ start:1320 stop:1568 length:249 start_codon:yes stop_codon:yes gene_type:complete